MFTSKQEKFTMKLPHSITLLLFAFLLQGCANYKLNYTQEAKNWQDQKLPTDLAIRHSMYLIGDTGNAKMGKTLPIFEYLKKELAKENENSSIIFLGDNIYPVGMPPKGEKEARALAEHKLDVQLEMLKDFEGKVMFVPGNHDWFKYGLKGIQRQEKYLEKHLNAQRGVEDDESEEWQDYFLPSNGCGDPEIVEINDQLVVVLIDSQWWLENWDTNQEINDGCDIKSRSFFKFQFEEALRKYRNRNVVVAMHHPLYSNGPHGGYFTVKEHFFPLTPLVDELYLPMPIFGSAIALFRRFVGVPHDLANAKYKSMRKDLLAGATKNGSYIFASGHEHNLQYIQKDRQHFIISGAGSKTNPTRVGDGGEFGYGKIGYSKIDFYEDGSAWLTYWTPNEDGTDAQLVFRKKIKEKLKISKENIPEAFPEYEQQLTEKIRQPNNYELKPVNGIHKAVLGDHYLAEYMEEYPFEVLDLSTFKGGVTPIKRGGGNQTNSLRLKGADGKQYAMRSLTKDATRALPYPVNQMAGAESILKDNFLAAYPFAASIVPKMAKAANIYHASPKLYYVPKQPALSYHNDLFGDDVYLIEERLGGNWEDNPNLGNSKKLISTLDVVDKITKNHKHRIDGNWVVRSRLFDKLVKDWDRHDDQWRWATLEDENGKFYRPIPRDRDQAFARYDGFAMRFIGAVSPFYRQLQTFSPDIKDIRWASWNAKYFDTNFIGEMEREDWEREARYIQENVTDEVIDAAFMDVPEAARTARWEQMKAYTKQRRDNIMKFAMAAYEYNSEQVDILGTEKRDLFEIERLSDTETRVRVFGLSKEGKKKKQRYERTFENAITKEIHIYALGDDDEFRLIGEANKGILIRLIGGVGEDKVMDKSYVKQGRKKTLVYDSSTEENILELGKEGKDKTSVHVAENTYVRKHNHYQTDYTMPLPVLGYTQDDGFILGVDVTHFKYQFKKFPYGQSHRFIADFATSPRAASANYKCEFLQVLGKWDVTGDLLYKGDRASFNFFGLGNASVNENPDSLLFNRVRQGKLYLGLGLRRMFAQGNGSFSIEPLIERTKIDPTEGRFIVGNNTGLDEDIFESKWYAGVKLRFKHEGLDQNVDPHNGMRFQLGYNLETNLKDSDLTFGKFNTALTIYTALDRTERLVWATQAGYEGIRGDYDFFKAPTIGGVANLRGFRAQRFRGERVLYHNNDLRLKLLTSINKVFPFSLGIHGGFDYGRTWSEDEDSDVWHTSYGGGIWVAPLNAVVLSFGQYVSTEDTRFVFRAGHQF